LLELNFGGAGLIAQALDGISACEEQAVVTIPGFDLVMGRKIWTDEIEHPITSSAETLPPKCIVLLIDVQDTALPGNCGGKQDSVGMPAKVIDESLRIAGVNVLAHFERDNEIEPASDIEALREVVRYETTGQNQESVAIDIVTIDTNIICDTGTLPFGQPRAATAAYIGD
jgi:hypothetical protein